MSKKKTSTPKPDATPPSVIPIMRSKGGKAKGKAKVADEQATPAATETPPVEDATTTTPPGQETNPATEAPTLSTDSVAGATLAPETPTVPTDSVDQATPAEEVPAADDAGAPKKKGKAKAKKAPKPKRMSALDAAAKVLTDAGAALTTGEMIEAMAKKKLWSSPNGQTPAATLYSAITREINTKGTASRFSKTERGKFAAKA